MDVTRYRIDAELNQPVVITIDVNSDETLEAFKKAAKGLGIEITHIEKSSIQVKRQQ